MYKGEDMKYNSYIAPIKNYNYAIKYEDYYGRGDYMNPIRNDSSNYYYDRSDRYQPGRFEGLNKEKKMIIELKNRPDLLKELKSLLREQFMEIE